MAKFDLAVFSYVMRSRRTALMVWSAAVAFVCGFYTGFQPLMMNDAMGEMIDAFPPALVTALGYDDMTSANGYVGATIYGLVGLVLLLIFANMNGARVIAGEEEGGRLELELTSPTPRAVIYTQRLAALWAQVAILAGAVFGGTALVNVVMTLGVDVGGMAVATVQLLLVAGFFASVSFALGAATGRRGLALAVASGLTVVSWMFNAIGPSIGAKWMQLVSPIGWYNPENPMTRGFQPADSALLVVASVVVIAAGWLRFSRRDVMT